MDISMLAKDADDLIRTNRVYGDPITVGDTTIILAARVGGGGGGGGGSSPINVAGTKDGEKGETEGKAEKAPESGEGAGGGLGFGARPTGAFVVREGNVRWEPAVDVNRLMLVVGAVAVAALLTARSIVKARPAS